MSKVFAIVKLKKRASELCNKIHNKDCIDKSSIIEMFDIVSDLALIKGKI